MNRKNGSGAGMFMMEMIVAVFFFILCASTCILVFVKADSLSRRARDTNGGVVAAESVAEVWKAGGTEGLTDRFQAQVQAGADEVKICWDREWNAVADEADASYLGVLSWEAQDGLETARIAVSRTGGGQTGGDQTAGAGAELFSMTAARYLPERS